MKDITPLKYQIQNIFADIESKELDFSPSEKIAMKKFEVLVEKAVTKERQRIKRIIKKEWPMYFKEGTDTDYVIRIRNKFRDELLEKI